MTKNIIKKGFALLRSKKLYDQITVVKKLKYLNKVISAPTFSNILNDRPVGDKTLMDASEGMNEIIKLELGMVWKNSDYINLEDKFWESVIVDELTDKDPSLILKPGFAFHEGGRLTIQQKVNFFSVAQKEVIELGVTLRTYTTNFYSRSDSEFKLPIEQLLKNGVNFKCYVLNPDCNEARIYFADRGQVQKDEINRPEIIKDTLRKLTQLENEFLKAGYKGKFEIYTYKHIPYNYCMAIDGSTINGKMAVSHYIYGIPRGKCPVIEFSKNTHHSLYSRYWKSLKNLTKDAQRFRLDQ